MSIEVMKQALGALETAEAEGNCEYGATSLLRTAIAKAESVEPMAWFHADNYKTRFTTDPSEDMIGRYWQPLYTAPRQWVELTDDEARALVNRATFGDKTNWQALVYMIDAKLKEKNG